MWFLNRDGLNYVGPKQTFPQIKAFSPEVTAADPHTKLGPSDKGPTTEYNTLDSEIFQLVMVPQVLSTQDTNARIDVKIQFQLPSNDP